MIAAALLVAVTAQARIITPAENQVWWGYFNESDFQSGDYTIGTGSPMSLMAAIYVPAKHEQLGRATIKAVRVYLAQGVISSLSGLKVWVSKTLPDKISDADYAMAASGTLSVGANDFKLMTPFEVDGNGFYIGYYVKSTTGYFIRCGGQDAENSFLVGNPEENMNWTDLYGQGLGKLAFQILVENGNFVPYGATAEDFGNSFVLKGESVNVPIKITNTGQETISSIAYTIATDGVDVTPERTLSVGSLAFNSSKTINMNFPADEVSGKYKKTFTITKVNDQKNTASGKSAQGFVITLDEKQPVTPVIEEFTGTWCGWCPRGMVGMEKMHDTFGDQIVQIAAHSGDIMAINEYQPVINTYTSGFPNSITDRRFEADPSYSSLNNVMSKAFERTAQGTIALTAEWASPDQKAVTFTTKTCFSYSETDGQYGIALVLTQDGLKGTGSNWAQSNYYSGGSGSSEMSFWYSAGSSVSGLEFNHVPVAAWSALTGIDGSVSPKIEAGKEQVFTYQGDISQNSKIQDKTKLKAIALLIDRSNGTIVNAAQAYIKEKETGISTPSVSDDARTAAREARYSLDGRKLSTAEKGINIIRMPDGTIRKVLVK